MHEALDKQEQKMLSDIHMAHGRMQKTSDAISNSQMMTLGGLESARSCQVKLTDRNDAYDYVTVTDSIKRDVEKHAGYELQRFKWNSEIVTTPGSGEQSGGGRVDIIHSEELEKVAKVKEVSRIPIAKEMCGEDNIMMGMVVYKQHVYAVHKNTLLVYCYKPDGSLGDVYRHGGGEERAVRGMSLMMDGETPMLVVSDRNNQSLVWIEVTSDFTMKLHHTQQVDYIPSGSYNNSGNLMVCDPGNHKIHRYRNDGEADKVITLPNDFKPCRLTRHGNRDDYVIINVDIELSTQVVMIDKHGQIKTRHKDKIHGVKLRKPWDVISDQHGGILIADIEEHHVLLLRDGDEVKTFLQKQHMLCPLKMYLDKDYNRLYVFCEDQASGEVCVLVYDYCLLTGDKTFTEKITQLEMKVEVR